MTQAAAAEDADHRPAQAGGKIEGSKAREGQTPTQNPKNEQPKSKTEGARAPDTRASHPKGPSKDPTPVELAFSSQG